MLLFALSTAHKVGLGLSVLVFAGFSLVVSMVIPRYRPQFPGKYLPAFLVVCVLLFIGMVSAVVVFGRESGEAAPPPPGSTTLSGGSSNAQQVTVHEIEFKIQLPKTTFAPGTYTFNVNNAGKVPHNLFISGPGVKKGTSNISPGSSASLTVDLQKGQYDFYCSIPGHKAAGMDQKVTVS